MGMAWGMPAICVRGTTPAGDLDGDFYCADLDCDDEDLERLPRCRRAL